LAAELLDRAHRVLKAAGYRHYELSNFALPGYECAHNIGYWRQRDCVAFGMSASGYEGGVRY
jgi:oxygen-independent coproporphyrinogen-3 oxidase